jgi:hypothetical protein
MISRRLSGSDATQDAALLQETLRLGCAEREGDASPEA